MTEAEAQAWIADRFGNAAVDRVGSFVDLLVEENGRQNLIAPSTIPTIWVRHVLDSAQLAEWGTAYGSWLDVGTGGGLPGFVLALLLDRTFELVEPRRLRAGFLARCVDTFGLTGRVIVHPVRVELVKTTASTISARAVSTIATLIRSARHCATSSTIWVLPRGQGGESEIQQLAMPAPARFHVKHSVTDPAATIVLAMGCGG